jgi:hypothetical protein
MPCFEVCAIGIHGGFGESVDCFRSAPTEEIVERLAICALTLRRGKRVQDRTEDGRLAATISWREWRSGSAGHGGGTADREN